MTDSSSTSTRTPTSGEVAVVYLVYGLHAFSALSGVLSPAFVLMGFLTGWPSIIAVILTYLKRGDVKDTYLASHLHWTLRTFWFGLLWVLTGAFLFATIIGLAVAILIWVGAGLWVLYRLVRGLLQLTSEQAMPTV